MASRAQVPQVSARGQFAVRGGILDVFSFQHALPLRIELFDDEIESLSYFDPLTGAITERVQSLTVYPKSHYVTPRDRMLKAVDLIKVELQERLAILQQNNQLVEAQRLRRRMAIAAGEK